MKKVSETDAIIAIDKTLSQVDDPSMRNRVLRRAWEKFSSSQEAGPNHEPVEDNKIRRRKAKRPPKKKVGRKSLRRKVSLSISKDLNLKPKSKKSFSDFAAEKQPTSQKEKSVVAVYYLQHEINRKPISSSDAYTCFKHMNWRVPADLPNMLQQAASSEGWLDTSDMKGIKITQHGENYVEHDLPKQRTKTKRAK